MAKFKLRRYVLYYLGRAAAFILYLFPLGLSLPIAAFFGSLAFLVLGKYRRTTVENLKAAFGGEKTDEEINAIARRVFENLSKSGIELLNFPKINKDNLGRLVTLKNGHILDEAFGRGKGIVLLTAHFGSWELLALTLRLNYPGVTLGRRLYFHKYDEFLNRLRRVHDVNVVYRDESPRKMLKILKDNWILGVVADQNIDSVGGVFVNFMGRPAYTPGGPVALAKASGAALIPALIIREDGHHTLMVEEPIELVDTGNKEADLVTNTQRWSDVIERYIRQYPDQWVWMHKRWKTQSRPE